MKKAVFPEIVVEGLNRWRADARKNVALKSNYTSTRPSLDTSPSLGTSPSFSLDASYSVKFDGPSDSEYLAVEIKDEEKEISRSTETDEHQKRGSLGGFDVGKHD